MKTEVRRGRKFVEYIDDSLPVGTFVQEIGVHDVSYQDENSVWQPIDENWEIDSLDGFSFRAQRMNHKVRFDSIGAWRWYPRRNVETEYIVINRPKCWLTRTNRWGNLLVNGISREGRDITLTSLRNVTRVIHSRWNGIKTDWILENADAPTRFQQQIDLVGLTEVDGWLIGADGEQVARLTPTTAIDAEGNELPTSTSYQNGILEFSADVTGAVFPVVIDPDYAGDTGDGYIIGNGETSSSSNLTNAFLQCGFTGNGISVRTKTRAYFKFDTSGIDDSHTITQVNLKLTPYSVTKAEGGAYFDVLIKKYDWGDLTLTDATDRETAYDGAKAASQDNSIWQNTANISANTQYASGNLATAWISKTGYTYYALMGKMDEDGETYDSGELSNVWFCSANHATEAYRPVLTVAHSAGGAQNLTLTCAAGSYSLTGTNVTLTHTPASQNLTLACSAGSYSLTGTNADLTVTRHYVLACNGLAQPSIAVSGAGSTAYNGTFAVYGTQGGKALYRKNTPEVAGGYAYIVYNEVYKYWFISPIDSGTGSLQLGAAVYYSADDVDTPDLVTTWQELQGSLPVPTVTAGTTYALTGSDVTLTKTAGAQNLTLTCESGSYSLTGTDATLTAQYNYSLTCEAGSYSLTGTDVDFVLQRNYSLECGAGSYALTGTDTTFEVKRNYTFECEAGSYSLTGSIVDLTVQRNYALACSAGNYLITGTDATLTVQRNYTLVCEPGSYSLTGTDITFGNSKAYSLTCEAGAYTLTGSSVSFVIQRNYTFVCEAGAYSLTGTDADLVLLRNYILACGAGTYALTGTNTALTSARTMAIESGSYSLTGTDADLYRALVMACNAGSYALTGTDATFNANYVFALGMGNYVLVGTSVGLFILSPTPACRTYTIDAEGRLYAIAGDNREFDILAENRTYAVLQCTDDD